MAVINKEIAYMALPLSIRRGNPFPIDEYSVWYDMEQLNNYAQTSPVAYVGQVVVYVDEDASTVEVYVIQNTAGTNTTQIATTAFVQTAISGKANLASPTFTGTPKSTTPTSTDNSTRIATTAFVKTALSSVGGGPQIVLSTSQPSGQSVGDFWYKQL